MGKDRASIRAIVVGLGVMGRHHVRVLSQIDGVEIVGLVDEDARARTEQRGLVDAPVYESADAALAARPDVAIVATPTSTHRDVCAVVLSGGVNVLVEKPIAATSAEGASLVSLAKERGLVFGVGHVERFNPVVGALHGLIQAGAIGTPHSFHARRFGPFPPRIRDVGVIIDLGTHDIDVVLHLHPGRLAGIQAEAQRALGGEREDSFTALLRFEDGVVATVGASWLSPMKVREIVATGDRGMLIADYQSQGLVLVEGAHGADERVVGPGYATERRSTDISVPRGEPLRIEIDAFLAALRGDRPFAVSGEQALRVLRVSETIRDVAERARSSAIVGV